MRNRILFAVGVLTALLLVPSLAHAQASITGVVRDASGAVLPGVTVEASSPALIERSRTVITDGTGQYRIVELRPGTYSVTFTLAGFRTVVRAGIELAGTFTATANVELELGALEETLTVTGEAPTVDVQGVTNQRVIGSEVIDAIPSSRTHFSVAALIPAVNSAASRGGTDVGGTNAIAHVFLTAHGGRQGDQRVMIEGLSTQNSEASGAHSGFSPNMGSAEELTVDVAAGSAERATGGVQVNIIPRQGGNVPRGSFYASGTGGDFLQSNNFTPELQARGLPAPNAIKSIWDFNPAFGGPLLRDKVWFYTAARWNGGDIYGGGFGNANADNPNAWTYVADTTPGFNHTEQRSVNLRLTWQITPKHKISGYYDDQYRCWCPRDIGPNLSQESVPSNEYPYIRMATVSWTSTLTNRLLLEAGALHHPERWGYPAHNSAMIGVVEQSTGRSYRGQTAVNSGGLFPQALNITTSGRASMSYVTGAHAFKAGISQQYLLRSVDAFDNDYNMTYRFNNGVPNQLTQRSTPFNTTSIGDADVGIFAQDRWTMNRLTLNLGVRFDYFKVSFPEQYIGPSLYTPNRSILFPATDWVSWKDVTPRLGASYDLFGDGRTAVKVTLNKYMGGFGLGGNFGSGSNPVNLISNQVTRSWNDANRNFTPDCDLVSPLANGECGAMSDQNFGQARPSTAVDPDILRGWGVRAYNWEFSASVQREIIPRVAAEVGYFRRWYGNFTLTDNRAVSAADYTTFSITAPVDARLPNGGGYTISGLYDLNPNRVGQVDNYFTSASRFGEQVEYWHGVDAGVNVRFTDRLLLQGGVSTGRTVTDTCEIKPDNPSSLFCHTETPFLSQVKLLSSYRIPVVDVTASATFQSLPGPQILANYVASNAIVAQSLGRSLSGGAANVTVPLVEPGTMYGERTNQLDLRFVKGTNFGRARLNGNIEIFNLTNSNAVQEMNNSYAAWQRPLSILQARIVKFGLQVEF